MKLPYCPQWGVVLEPFSLIPKLPMHIFVIILYHCRLQGMVSSFPPHHWYTRTRVMSQEEPADLAALDDLFSRHGHGPLTSTNAHGLSEERAQEIYTGTKSVRL